MLHTEVHVKWLSQGKETVLFESASCTCHFFHGIPFVLEWTAKTQNDGFQTSVFGRHFLQNEHSKPVTSRKAPTIFVATDKIWTFKWKLECWRLVFTTMSLDRFPILKYFLIQWMMSLTNVIFLFWYPMTKYVNILWPAQLSKPIFSNWPMHNALNHTLNEGSILKHKPDQQIWILMAWMFSDTV